MRAFDEFSAPVRDLLAEYFRLRASAPLDPEEIPAVGAARNLIADTIASLPLIALDNGVPVPNQPAIVRRPDPSEPRFQTLHRICMQLTAGHTYGGNVWMMPTFVANDGTPEAATLLEPRECAPILDSSQRCLGVTWAQRRLFVDGGQVVHLPFRITGRRGTLGDSPITEARTRFEGLAALYQFQNSYWQEFGAPSIVLETPQRVNTKAEADAVREAWLGTHGGKRTPAVASGGGKITSFLQDQMGAELVAAEAAATAEVARAHLIAPSLLNALLTGSSLTYSNTRDELRRWRLTGLNSFIVRIETLFTELWSAGGLFPNRTVRLDTSEFLRLDERERAEVDAIDIGSGVITVEQAIARRGPLPTMNGVLA